ncbi:MAG: response regulator [Pseudomonadota bacterium]
MKKCLIIDDSEVIREIIVRLVKDLGLEPLEATSAGEGVEICGGASPAVVLLDWDLPKMGALDFLRGAGAMDADKRPEIVLCATENDHQQFTLAKAAGAKHHLLKPFNREMMEELFVAIGVLDGPAPQKAESKASQG